MKTKARYEDCETKSVIEIYQTEIEMVKKNRFLDRDEKRAKLESLVKQLRIEENK